MRVCGIYDREQALSVQVINGEYAHEIIETLIDGRHMIAWKAVIDGKAFGNYLIVENQAPLEAVARERLHEVIARNVMGTYQSVRRQGEH